jgi:hypothetical protein
MGGHLHRPPLHPAVHLIDYIGGSDKAQCRPDPAFCGLRPVAAVGTRGEKLLSQICELLVAVNLQTDVVKASFIAGDELDLMMPVVG